MPDSPQRTAAVLAQRIWHTHQMNCCLPHRSLHHWLVASLLLCLNATTADAADACATLIPPALATRLGNDLPAFRLPQSSDLGADRMQELNTSGDWPCPLVIAGDFDGNGWLDRALLLPPRQGGQARLIVALNQSGAWQLSLSDDWPLELVDSELRPQESGFYQRADAIAQPTAQLDQLASLQADHSAFRAGKPKGDYALYALVNGKWLKLSMPGD